jgi:hypothetical protein
MHCRHLAKMLLNDNSELYATDRMAYHALLDLRAVTISVINGDASLLLFHSQVMWLCTAHSPRSRRRRKRKSPTIRLSKFLGPSKITAQHIELERIDAEARFHPS